MRRSYPRHRASLVGALRWHPVADIGASIETELTLSGGITRRGACPAGDPVADIGASIETEYTFLGGVPRCSACPVGALRWHPVADIGAGIETELTLLREDPVLLLLLRCRC